ncbi:MAG: hypothetical protein ACKVT2_10610, partial [Saprospiraceae bacterium]
MKSKLVLLAIFCQMIHIGTAAAQEARRDSSKQFTKRDSLISFFGTPLAFFSPDTRWGVGAAGILTFPTRPRRSNLTFNFSYTQNKQVLIFFPFQWLSTNNRWRVYGELGWYRYLYRYFGIGNKYPNDYEETYTAKYPRIRISAAKRVRGKHLIGLRFFLDDYHIASASPDGEIALGKVP